MIVGITGSFGAGKGAVAEYLVKEKGFQHFSARAFIVEEIEKRNITVDRDTMIAVANDLRAEHGPTYIIESLFKKAAEHKGDAVIESIREVAGAKYIKQEGGVVIGVDADPKIRYSRTTQRGSETDHVSFEKWKDQEKQELNPDDPTKQDIFGALKESDFVITNNSTLKELHKQVDNVLAELTVE